MKKKFPILMQAMGYGRGNDNEEHREDYDATLLGNTIVDGTMTSSFTQHGFSKTEADSMVNSVKVIEHEMQVMQAAHSHGYRKKSVPTDDVPGAAAISIVSCKSFVF